MGGKKPTIFLSDLSEGFEELAARCRDWGFEVSSNTGLPDSSEHWQAHPARGADLCLIRLLPSDKLEVQISQLKRFARASRIVVMAETFSSDQMRQLLSAGADGFLTKTMSPESIREQLERVLSGVTVLAPMATAPRTVSVVQEQDKFRPSIINYMSAREMEIEILKCLMAGQSNKEIAKALDIPVPVLRQHLRSLMGKLQQTNITPAAVQTSPQIGKGEGLRMDGQAIPLVE